MDQEIIKKYSPDVFMHTWSTTGQSHKEKKYSISKPVKAKHLQALYSPKKIIIEDFHQSYFDELHGVKKPEILSIADPKSSKGVLPMYYGISQANALRKQYESETGISYDAVIRCRPDLQITNLVVPFDRLLQENIFLVTVGMSKKHGRRYVWDPIFISDPKTMDHISSIWENMGDIFLEPLGPNNAGLHDPAYQMAGSRLLSRWLDDFPEDSIFRSNAKVAVLRVNSGLTYLTLARHAYRPIKEIIAKFRRK